MQAKPDGHVTVTASPLGDGRYSVNLRFKHGNEWTHLKRVVRASSRASAVRQGRALLSGTPQAPTLQAHRGGGRRVKADRPRYPNLTIEKLADRYVGWLRDGSERKDGQPASVATIDVVNSRARSLVSFFGGTPIEEIATRVELERYRRYLATELGTPGSRNNHLRTLLMMLRFAHRENILREPPYSIQLFPMGEQKTQHLEEWEISTYRAEAKRMGLDVQIALEFGISLGMRGGEWLGVKKSAVQLVKSKRYPWGYLRLNVQSYRGKAIPTKTKTDDRVDLTPLLFSLLQKAVKANKSAMILERNGGINAGQPHTWRTIANRMKELHRACGHPERGSSTHFGRHTCATQALQVMGGNIMHAMTVTRHKSLAAFRRYVHIADTTARDARLRMYEDEPEDSEE